MAINELEWIATDIILYRKAGGIFCDSAPRIGYILLSEHN